MKPSEFENRLKTLMGESALLDRAARAFGVNRSTMWRWLSGQSNIPPPALVLLDLIEKLPDDIRPPEFDKA